MSTIEGPLPPPGFTSTSDAQEPKPPAPSEAYLFLAKTFVGSYGNRGPLARWGFSQFSFPAAIAGATAEKRTVLGAGLVREMIAELDRVLKILGNRDRDGIKAGLVADRERLAKGLALFESLIPDAHNQSQAESVMMKLTGPLARDLQARFGAACGAVAAAEMAFKRADRAAVREARAQLDEAEADKRALCREIEALAEACTFPKLPQLESVKAAERQTKALLERGKPLSKLHEAFAQGAEATPDVARFWVCFEASGSQDLFSARWGRFLEARGGAPPQGFIDSLRDRVAQALDQ